MSNGRQPIYTRITGLKPDWLGNLSENSTKESEDWLGDRHKEMKVHDFSPIKISKIKHSCNATFVIYTNTK